MTQEKEKERIQLFGLQIATVTKQPLEQCLASRPTSLLKRLAQPLVAQSKCI